MRAPARLPPARRRRRSRPARLGQGNEAPADALRHSGHARRAHAQAPATATAAAPRSTSAKRTDPCFDDPRSAYGKTPAPETPYQRAAQVWDDRIGSARVQARNWRLALLRCARPLGHPRRRPAVAECARVDHSLGGCKSTSLVRRRRSRLPIPITRPADPDRLPSGAVHRGRPRHPRRPDRCAPELAARLRLRHRQRRARAQRLCPDQRSVRPVGAEQVAVDVTSVIRASPNSFRVAWIERRYRDGSLAGTSRWTAIARHRVQTAAHSRCASARTRWAFSSTAINWSKELSQ